MLRKIWRSLLFLGLVLTAVGCASRSLRNGPDWSYVKFTDPVCADITLDILNAFHVPHRPDTIPFAVWQRWKCIRNTNAWGRLTTVLLREPKPYYLRIVFDPQGRAIKQSTDPGTWEAVIGPMASYARFDSATDRGRALLAKQGSIAFKFYVHSD